MTRGRPETIGIQCQDPVQTVSSGMSRSGDTLENREKVSDSRKCCVGILSGLRPSPNRTVMPSRMSDFGQGREIVDLRVQTAVFAVSVKAEVVLLRPRYHAAICISLH